VDRYPRAGPERNDPLLDLASVLVRLSPLSGDGLGRLLGTAAATAARLLDGEAVHYAGLELGGLDAIAAQELGWSRAVVDAGLPSAVVPPDVAAALTAEPGVNTVVSGAVLWLAVRGPAGALFGALAVHRPGAPFRAAELAGAGKLADLVAGTLARMGDTVRLARTARMLEDTQRHTQVGSFEWDVVTNRVQWSDELYRLYGCEPQSFDASFEEFLQRIHPDDRASIQESVTRAYEDRSGYRIEERIIRPDGEVRQLTSWGEVVVDPDGVPLKIIGSCQDVTELRRMTRELAASEARFRALVESAPDAVVVCEADGTVLDANPAAASLFRRPVHELVGTRFGRLVVEGHAQVGDEPSVEVDVRTVELPGRGAHVRAAFVRDISERAAAEEAAQLRRDRELRRAQALMLNDNVVQSLASAAFALDADQLAQAARAVQGTLKAAREMMSNLLAESEQPLVAGALVRPQPAPGVLDPAAFPLPPPAPASIPPGTVSVVVVDDNDDFRFLVRSVLDPREGVVVVGEAGDGIDALTALRRHRPDVVVLDLGLPGLDGLGVLERIADVSPGTAAVVLSGFPGGDLAVLTEERGAVTYVEKGNLDNLLEVVRQAGRSQAAWTT
jgi:PAS domain S-box-containing protein